MTDLRDVVAQIEALPFGVDPDDSDHPYISRDDTLTILRAALQRADAAPESAEGLTYPDWAWVLHDIGLNCRPDGTGDCLPSHREDAKRLVARRNQERAPSAPEGLRGHDFVEHRDTGMAAVIYCRRCGATQYAQGRNDPMPPCPAAPPSEALDTDRLAELRDYLKGRTDPSRKREWSGPIEWTAEEGYDAAIEEVQAELDRLFPAARIQSTEEPR